MTGRVIRFPIADPWETALVAATELDPRATRATSGAGGRAPGGVATLGSCTTRESEAGAFAVSGRLNRGSAGWWLD
jgi:hypothetical protein